MINDVLTDAQLIKLLAGLDFPDDENQSSQTSPGMTSRDSQGLQAERNGRKRPKFRVVKKLPTIPDIQEEEFLPASLVKQVKKRIVVRKKEEKCSTC